MFAALTFQEWDWPWFAAVARHPALSGVLLVVVGGLMVSTLPTWSFKNFKVPAEYVLPLLLGTGAYVAVLLTEPWAALATGGLMYATMVVLSGRSYRRLKREAEAMLEPVLVSNGEDRANG